MNLLRRYVVLTMILNATSVYAQHIGAIEQPMRTRMMKPQNGLIITWMEGRVYEADVNQVDIFDERGHRVTGLNVLRPVQDASRVSIYDVSARPGSIIAVAALHTSEEIDGSLRMVNSLLVFDFSGQLLSAFALEPRLGIRKLAVDDKANIWTLTDNDGYQDPATVPLIVEYSPEGTVIREVLTRNQFPLHAGLLKEDLEIGRISMGLDSGVLWVWLPGSTDFIAVSTSDGKTTLKKTQMPKRANFTEVPISKVIREPAGDLIAEFREEGQNDDYDLAYYRWSPSQGQWSLFKPGACDGERLEGISGDRQIYLRYGAEHTDICAFQAQ